jgi:hypothetical protein
MPGMTRLGLWSLSALVIAGAASTAAAAPKAPGPEQLIGTWRGTSVCTDRVAAPACKDEVVVYEFTAGARPGAVHWAADKVVNGERGRMGEFDVTYDAAQACWKGEFQSPRVHSVWCLKVEGTRLTGSGRLLPGNEIIRKIDARKD